MSKKARKAAGKSTLADPATADASLAVTVRDSAQQIWLAGLGAFAKAQAEGSQAFDALVKEGASLQRRNQALVAEQLGEMAQRFSSVAGELTRQAAPAWERLESIFETRVAKALTRLATPSRQELETLLAHVERLDRTVASLVAASTPAQPMAKASRQRRDARQAGEDAAAPAARRPAARKPAAG